MRDLPHGTVTLLFTDIEGSTRLLHELGDAYANVLAEHRRVLREVFGRHGGVEVDTQGDAFFYAFAGAAEAIAAAAEAQSALGEGPVRVRIGVHTGEPVRTEEGYVGVDVHRAARIMSAGHGGQVLVSDETRALIDGAFALTDMGLHRLKDLTEPQRLWQLGDSEFAPLKTLYQTNLPIQPSALVGRERELAQLLELLKEARLVTLTGAGGSGKTRLAVHAAAELTGEFKDGVWWVPLAAVPDAELVDASIAGALGAKENLAEYLRPKTTLLLLDNFEHLLGAAPLVAQLLADAPDLRILVTSREHLALAAEHAYLVPTMVVTEAVALFTARARQLRPRFEPDDAVAAICRRLDGLPLAIELAAARLNVLRPDQILERLAHSLDLLTTGGRDVAPRHQTLRATIEWSYDLLDNDEKRLFARLGVFAGAFDLDLAEAVCGADMDLLGALVDANLVRRSDDERFFMLETIREYATELLERSPEAAELRRKHAHTLLARVGAPGDPRERRDWRAAIDRDHANYRAALRWFDEQDDSERLLRLASQLGLFWDGREYLHEGRAWLEQALRASSAPSIERARALVTLGHIAWRQGALDVALTSSDEAAALASELGSWDVVAEAHATRGAVHYQQGEFAVGRTEFERALELYRSLNAADDVAVMTHDLGLCAFVDGDHVRARQYFEESLLLCRQRDYKGGEMNTLGDLGILDLEEGRLGEAKEALRAALQLALDFDVAGVASAYHLIGFAAVLAREGDLVSAAFLIAASDAHHEQIDAAVESFIQPVRTRALHEIDRRVDSAEAASARERGRAVSLKDAMEYAVSLD